MEQRLQNERYFKGVVGSPEWTVIYMLAKDIAGLFHYDSPARLFTQPYILAFPPLQISSGPPTPVSQPVTMAPTTTTTTPYVTKKEKMSPTGPETEYTLIQTPETIQPLLKKGKEKIIKDEEREVKREAQILPPVSSTSSTFSLSEQQHYKRGHYDNERTTSYSEASFTTAVRMSDGSIQEIYEVGAPLCMGINTALGKINLAVSRSAIPQCLTLGEMCEKSTDTVLTYFESFVAAIMERSATRGGGRRRHTYVPVYAAYDSQAAIAMFKTLHYDGGGKLDFARGRDKYQANGELAMSPGDSVAEAFANAGIPMY